MSLGPLNRWDTGLPFDLQFMRNNQVFDISLYPTTAVRLHFWQQTSKLHKLGKGSVVFTSAPDGMFRYTINRHDTDTPGLWDVWAEIFTAQAGSISSTNTEKLQINDRPSDYVRFGMGRIYVVRAQPVQVSPVP